MNGAFDLFICVVDSTRKYWTITTIYSVSWQPCTWSTRSCDLPVNSIMLQYWYRYQRKKSVWSYLVSYQLEKAVSLVMTSPFTAFSYPMMSEWFSFCHESFSFTVSLFLFAVRLLLFPWGYSFLPWNFLICQSHEGILFPWVFFFLPWVFYFCCEVISFSRDSCGLL